MGWSLNGFWIEVITNEKVINYKEGYTLGHLNRDVKSLYLPFIDEWYDRVGELCNFSKYSFDYSFDIRSKGNDKYWIFYFKIWIPRGPKETPSYLYGSKT